MGNDISAVEFVKKMTEQSLWGMSQMCGYTLVCHATELRFHIRADFY
jgi:hypothetical protein